MATQITPSLRSALERLKNGGAVNGIMLGWRRQLLLNLLPFEDFRAERLLETLHDAQDHFASGGDRSVSTFWFGYETCHALTLFRGDCVITLLHTRAEEADFLRRAAQTFLEDSQLLIDALLNPVIEETEDEPDHDANLTSSLL
ncbi:MAG: hypothetical protein NTV80_14570 [Verrucomicrobia bacterium]|nr:hypothetical protein [Verrucomicrobiota bacterium]